MPNASVISVNPSAPTEGSLYPEASRRGIRFKFRTPAISKKASHHLINAVLAVYPKMKSSTSLFILVARSALALFIALGAVQTGSPAATLGLIAASMILTGVATRWTALASFVYSGSTAVMAMASTGISLYDIPAFPLMLSLCSLALAVSGAGKFSADGLIRRILTSIHRYCRSKIATEMPCNKKFFQHD